MRILGVFVLLLASAAAQAQPSGLPGTATPQPYAQPQINSLPMTPQRNAPLLVNPGQPSRVPSAIVPPPAKDQPLPALQSKPKPQVDSPQASELKP